MKTTSSHSSSTIRIRVALISILSSTLILALKWVAYLSTGSAALKSDALEGIVNVVAAFFALGALVYSEQPSDRDHPYGHGKMEYFSAAFEGGLVTLAAVLILYEGAMAILSGQAPHAMGMGLLINGISGALNGLLGFFLIWQGKKHYSAAIEADGHHVMGDFMTTVGMLIGLGISTWTGWVWMDGLVAMLIGLLLVRTGFQLVKRSSAALLDEEDVNVLEKVVKGFNRATRPEIVAVHEMKTLRSGRLVHVDAHIVIPEFFSVGQGHDLVEKHCFDVLKSLDMEGEFHSHIDPCRQAYCKECQMVPCSIRKESFVSISKLTVEKAIQPGPAEIWD